MNYRPTAGLKAGAALFVVLSALGIVVAGQEGVLRGAEHPPSFCPKPNTVLAFPALMSLYELANMPPDALLPCFFMDDVLSRESFDPNISALDEAVGRQYKLSLLDKGSINLDLSTVEDGQFWKELAPESLQIVLVSKNNDGTYHIAVAADKQTYLRITRYQFNNDSYGQFQPSDAFQAKFGDRVLISAHPEFEQDGEHESLQSYIEKLTESDQVSEIMYYSTDEQGNLVVTSLKQTS